MLRSARIRRYLSLMAERGISEAVALDGTGIEATKIRSSDSLIREDQCRRVITNMLDALVEPGLGLEVGRRGHLMDLGVAGCAAMTCQTMRQAMMLWAGYGRSLGGVLSQLTVVEHERDLTFRVTEPLPGDPLCVFCTEELLGLICALGAELAGRPPDIREINLSYPAPTYAHRYADIFQCPIRFDAPETTVALEDAWLDEIRPEGEQAFNHLCMQYFGQTFAQIRAQEPFSTRLRNLFSTYDGHFPTLDEAASKLGVSSRSLRRYLNSERATYKGLLDNYRAELATKYLVTESRKPKEIAYLLGFHDQNSFRRAFKQWTGRTTREFCSYSAAEAKRH